MQSIFVLRLQGFAFLMVDLTFHVHWQIIFQFRSQPPCSGSFVCLGSNRSLANRADATVEDVLARSQKCPPKLRPDLYNQERYATIATCWTATSDHDLTRS